MEKLPEGWRKIELGNPEYFTILSSGINEFKGEKEYLSTESVQGTKIEKIKCVITYKDRPSRANMQPTLNSVWFAKMQVTVKVYSFGEENKHEIDKYILSTGFAGIKVNEKLVFPKYIRLVLISNDFNKIKDKLCTGSTQRGINNQAIRTIPLILPPFSTQQKIVSILEKAERAKEMRKEADELTKEFLKSVFVEMFEEPRGNKNFPSKKLKNLCFVKSGGTPSRKNPHFFKGNIPWITTVALGPKYINTEDAVEFITKEAVEKSATKEIPKNSIMVGIRVGVGKASINKCSICASQDILSLVNIDRSLNKEFLLEILNYYKQYFETQKRGATIQGITSNTLKELDIILPPIQLQNKFSEIVKQLEQIKQNQKESKQQIDDLFNALIQKAFRGELIC